MTAYGLTSEELIDRIAGEGAGLNSGEHYGKAYDGFVRISGAAVSRIRVHQTSTE